MNITRSQSSSPFRCSLAAPRRSRLLLLLLSLLISTPSRADPPDEPAPHTDELAKQSHAIAAAIRMETLDGQAVEMLPEPVFRYGDPARDDEGGTEWLWTRDGRPVALMEMFYKTHGGRRVQVFSLLGEQQVTAAGGDNLVWRPTTTQTTPIPLDGPAPAANAVVRLRQMKGIAREFRGHEFWDPDNSRFELRVLPQPVYRYAAPDIGIVDGTIYLLCHGTNPEIAVLIEARGPSADAAKWTASAARLGHAEMHLLRGEQELWKAARLDNPATDEPYYLFYLEGTSHSD